VKLQKSTRLALWSVLEFAARPDENVSAAEVASRYGESVNHLAKVLAELARAGIVESVRGAGGGYRFVGTPRRLTLLDVIRLFEDLGDGSPPLDPRRARFDPALRSVLAEIDGLAVATFGSITIATMLRMAGIGSPDRPDPPNP
jgi:Rrf2 family protein